jgi:hypothetical protein
LAVKLPAPPASFTYLATSAAAIRAALRAPDGGLSRLWNRRNRLNWPAADSRLRAMRTLARRRPLDSVSRYRPSSFSCRHCNDESARAGGERRRRIEARRAPANLRFVVSIGFEKSCTDLVKNHQVGETRCNVWRATCLRRLREKRVTTMVKSRVERGMRFTAKIFAFFCVGFFHIYGLARAKLQTVCQLP